ncbi:hypothetical protein RFEPED_0731 [Rickettsia felis str. Pedreira]|uniref:Uncharacterized protein n=2 Tax=Rickettsia felis TaxID=42862 RepID=A0A0F3MRS2_RICFI|nr:hypothetical protein [Rickettsia felis]AAY61021.1 unknown [Rickettsia felis URRWXCal2]KJV58351.1 hypothetical protein RFEPED_0731 [Rickettsia felis str. Pedreira]MDE8610823.1 hypothetical protein [Rickettsia felis]
MKISFSFFKQLLELLTSDWRSYLNKVITELEKLALTDTNDTFLKEECYRKIALIKGYIKEGEYPWYVVPFDKKDNASLLLTNIHMLELDYLNQNTVKAVKNMLRNNFKDIYNPEIYIIANYEEPIIKNYTITDKIAKGKIITFEDLNIKYEAHTNEELTYIDDIVNDIRKLDTDLVAELSKIIKFIHQFYFVDSVITQCTIIFMAAYFEELQNFHQNLDNLNFIVPSQKYQTEYQPKNYKNFINIEAITWNRFLVKYQKLFDNLGEEHSEILFSICSDNEDFVELLISDSMNLSLNKRIEIIKYLINEYKNDIESIYPIALQLFNICDDKDGLVKFLTASSYNLSLQKRVEIIEYLIGKYKNDTKSIYYITEQLFNICNDNTNIKTIETEIERFYKYVEYYRSWDGLPSYWHMDFKGLPGFDTKSLIIGNSALSENDYE